MEVDACTLPYTAFSPTCFGDAPSQRLTCTYIYTQHQTLPFFFLSPSPHVSRSFVVHFVFFLRSVTTCNSPLNGSLLVYSLGERAETAPAVRVGSHGHLLSVAIHVVELLDWAFLRRIFDTRCDKKGKDLFLTQHVFSSLDVRARGGGVLRVSRLKAAESAIVRMGCVLCLGVYNRTCSSLKEGKSC